MIEDLKQVQDIFLDPSLDEDELEYNRQKIAEWEQYLQENTAYKDWQHHEITQEIVKKARHTYKEIATILWQNRNLDDDERQVLYARQDAAEWILSLTARNVEQEIASIQSEIKQAINMT